MKRNAPNTSKMLHAEEEASGKWQRREEERSIKKRRQEVKRKAREIKRKAGDEWGETSSEISKRNKTLLQKGGNIICCVKE